MAQLNLHPCAVQTTWHSDQVMDGTEWINALGGYLLNLGETCLKGGGSLIGHIKGIAMVAGSPCLQLSLVSLNQPVSVDGLVPDKTCELHMTLNVLVFGMTADDLTAAINTSREKVLTCWPGSIEIEILPAATDYPLAYHGASIE